jgi:TonB family protein
VNQSGENVFHWFAFCATILSIDMKLAVVAAAIFVCLAQPATGEDRAALQQLLVSASQRSQLAHDPSGPYQLDVEFDTQQLVPAHGHLTLKWEADDRWWRRTDLGDFHQIEVKNGQWHFISRNANFTPLRVKELIELLAFAYDAGDYTAKKSKRRTENGVEMNCIRIQINGSIEDSHEVCLSAGSNDIVLDELKVAPNVQRRAQFSDYFDFSTHRYPRKLELIQNSSEVIKAQVIALTSAAFDESLFNPAPGAIARRECDGMKPAHPLKSLNLSYPVAAQKSGIGGTATFTVTVLEDGSVGDIEFEETAGKVLDANILKTIRATKFAPAMCGPEPVTADIDIEVDFLRW